MTFLSPERLWLLLAIVAVAGLYVWAQLRRRRRAVRFPNLALLRSVAPRRPGWRRHAPALAAAAALAATVVGLAEPTRQFRIPKEAATVMLVIDTSASMQASDIEPSRLDAAIDAAQDFVDDLPNGLRVGLISFDRSPRLLASPTTDHDTVRQRISDLTLGPGTAAGDALHSAVDAIVSAEAAAAGLAPGTAPTRPPGEDSGAAIVLLSDGVTTIGSSVLSAAQAAADAAIPVNTIAFGTDHGTVFIQGNLIPVPADPETMSEVAELTAGKFFEAGSGEELKSVYEDIGTTIGYETERRDVSGGVLAMATVALTLALGLGLLWNGRLL